MTIYWEDEGLTLYCGNMMELLPSLRADAIITDPPYGETNFDWDEWPDGWLSVAAGVTSSMWCFGSLRMFMARTAEFTDWKFSHDVVWHKHNGSSPMNDRFRRIHELAAHFYRGKWGDVYKSVQTTNDATARTVRRQTAPKHWGNIGRVEYATDAGGPRLMTSVQNVRGCHGSAIHPTEKPLGIISPLMEYSVPPAGLVVDCFAGSGVVLEAARKTGRRAIGIEISEKRCELIVKRLAQLELL